MKISKEIHSKDLKEPPMSHSIEENPKISTDNSFSSTPS